MKRHVTPWKCTPNRSNKLVHIETADSDGNQLFFEVAKEHLNELSASLRQICNGEVEGTKPSDTLWNKIKFWGFPDFENWRIFYRSSVAPSSFLQISGHLPISSFTVFDLLAKNSDGYQISVSREKLIGLYRLLDETAEQQRAEQGVGADAEPAL